MKLHRLIVLAVPFILTCSHAAVSPAVRAETRNQYLYILRPVRLEMLTSGPTQQEMQVLGEHAAYLEKLTADGVLLVGGRTQNRDATTMGLAIFLAPSEAAARQIMENDPVVRNGVMTATLFPYEIAFGTLAPKDR